MREDKEIVAYLAKVVKNEYIRLSKRYCKIKNSEVPLIDDIIQSNSNFEDTIEMKLTLKKALEELTPLQKNIIEKVVLMEIKEDDVAKELCITRQAVNKAKQRAIENLRKSLQIQK